ncbi:hypothetical protein EMIHUDRAFT_440441 [Emiliania huxleyi CCMP1516]|uniref:RCC1-like domain-containing protein n=2 Tax=Emiliania huxleyi TaxID=2903 RepID=A0A0D3KMY7_EMIH1|nr:hypothetical protein EMIHUDRAFT_440441 [Emiliania huxleyi CCMP1516]EOD37122.1 hypothetical protein EMIHUDRAFT_440441 [Emiliania huxleyi CCMP1516]|eukprot:XP_005789551.1 hypothetical protein EMIHUDRAFT_440441 [Emiliania huxleyi CCMP1516]
MLGDERAVSVAAGAYHSLALTADGSVWSWGGGFSGQLGHGDEQDQLLPKKIETFAGRRVVAVSVGLYHSIAITADGSAWSWGDGDYGRLGHGDQQDQLLPKQVEAFAGQRVVAVSAGARHSLATTADGAAWSWGLGGAGRLGHGDQQRQLLPKRVEAFAGRRVVAVAAGGIHSLAITADGAVLSWGDGVSGRLGHGDTQNQLLPKKVETFAGRRVVAVSAGDRHSIAITADGAVWSWAMEPLASWATATSRTSCCPSRSKPSLGSASSLCRLRNTIASPSPPTAVFMLGVWANAAALGPRRGPVAPAAAQEDRAIRGEGAGAVRGFARDILIVC